jgi:hypothetical protein
MRTKNDPNAANQATEILQTTEMSAQATSDLIEITRTRRLDGLSFIGMRSDTHRLRGKSANEFVADVKRIKASSNLPVVVFFEYGYGYSEDKVKELIANKIFVIGSEDLESTSPYLHFLSISREQILKLK